jgi:hypothetical protein
MSLHTVHGSPHFPGSTQLGSQNASSTHSRLESHVPGVPLGRVQDAPHTEFRHGSRGTPPAPPVPLAPPPPAPTPSTTAIPPHEIPPPETKKRNIPAENARAASDMASAYYDAQVPRRSRSAEKILALRKSEGWRAFANKASNVGSTTRRSPSSMASAVCESLNTP